MALVTSARWLSESSPSTPTRRRAAGSSTRSVAVLASITMELASGRAASYSTVPATSVASTMWSWARPLPSPSL